MIWRCGVCGLGLCDGLWDKRGGGVVDKTAQIRGDLDIILNNLPIYCCYA